MELSRLDLNLLVALDALLQQRSVSKAAAQTGVGQPAMSSSLARLRRHFDDELLVRTGNEYRLTPLALDLRERARMAIAGFQRVFGARHEFDPARSSREFTMLISDYGETVLGQAVANLLAVEAPRVRLRYLPNSARPLDQSDPTLLATDLVVMPHGFVTDLRHEDLYRDEWVCLVWAGNPAVGKSLTFDDLRTLPWVVTFNSAAGTTQGMANLRLNGVEPDVRVVTQHFLTVPSHVAGSDRIGLLQRRLLDDLPPREDIRVLACPFDAGSLTVAMWWHPVHDDDPAHVWFRGLVSRAAAADTSAG